MVIDPLLDAVWLTSPSRTRRRLLQRDRRMLAGGRDEGSEFQNAGTAGLHNLHDWAQLAPMSTRSLTRRFAIETGMSLSAWQQRGRLLAAEERLARGERVTQVAGDVRYDSPGAFSAAFRRAHGCSPTDYVARLRAKPGRALGRPTTARHCAGPER
jgi:AraC-like DNA-binding protein